MKAHASDCIVTIDGIDLQAFYSFTPARRATRDPGGNITEPAEPASIELTGLYLVDKYADILDLLLSCTEDDIIEEILENIADAENSCE